MLLIFVGYYLRCETGGVKGFCLKVSGVCVVVALKALANKMNALLVKQVGVGSKPGGVCIFFILSPFMLCILVRFQRNFTASNHAAFLYACNSI